MAAAPPSTLLPPLAPVEFRSRQQSDQGLFIASTLDAINRSPIDRSLPADPVLAGGLSWSPYPFPHPSPLSQPGKNERTTGGSQFEPTGTWKMWKENRQCISQVAFLTQERRNPQSVLEGPGELAAYLADSPSPPGLYRIMLLESRYMTAVADSQEGNLTEKNTGTPYHGKHAARSAQLIDTAAVVSWVLLAADSAVGLLTIVIHRFRCNSALLQLGGSILVLLGAANRHHTQLPLQLCSAAIVSIANFSILSVMGSRIRVFFFGKCARC
ncbi:hypothetical protein UY3_04023 [Chelonia mydas]|uniref:Uncharacterized protein n=1 Tax=Chelonia mydas TaxID=8469 RepID=M7BN97_CHEMY|nr:hypothetical protein UY3_04023 [Chelonia mydas]